MRLLVSSKNRKEIREALEGGADIIDVKNPLEGSLGANFPSLIRYARKALGRKELSCTVGDVPNLPGTISLAVLGAATCGADYIKIGLLGPKNGKQVLFLLRKTVEAVKGFDTRIIAACYADFDRAGTINPSALPRLAYDAGCFGCMVDTLIKDGKSLFDFLSFSLLRDFIEASHAIGLLCALAGSLKRENMKKLRILNPDIVGVRGAVCTGGRNGTIDKRLVASLKKSL